MIKKLTKRQLVLVICLICVAIFSLSYQYIYVKFVTLTQGVTVQTELTRQQITQREQELAEEATLKVDTENNNVQINDMINSFPVFITKEDNLIFIEKLEKKLNMDIPYVDVSENVAFYTTILPIRNENGEEIIGSVSSSTTDGTAEKSDSEAVQENADLTAKGEALIAENTVIQSGTETYTETNTASTEASEAPSDQAPSQEYMTGLQSSIRINFQTTYQGFKKLVNYLNQYPELTSIEDATLSYDGSTGDLVGGMTIHRYALTGTGKVYEEPYIGNISIGKDNLFGK